MKTLTEFAVVTLKNALQKKQELTTAGKTAEELPAAMGEALKLEGDKLTYLMGALEALGEKAHNDLKRIVVSSLNEGESAPSNAKLIGEKYYTVEHYTSMKMTPPPREEERGGRGGRGGRDGKGRGGRDGKPGGGRDGKPGGDRGSRGPGGGDRAPRGAAGGAPKGPVALPKPLSAPTPKPAAE